MLSRGVNVWWLSQRVAGDQRPFVDPEFIDRNFIKFHRFSNINVSFVIKSVSNRYLSVKSPVIKSLFISSLGNLEIHCGINQGSQWNGRITGEIRCGITQGSLWN